VDTAYIEERAIASKALQSARISKPPYNIIMQEDFEIIILSELIWHLYFTDLKICPKQMGT
jgi:hypothetical protein